MTWVTVGVSVGSALLGSRGAKKAAKIRAQAYGEAAGITDQAYDEAAGFFDPRLEQERAAMGRVNALLGLPGGDGSDPSAVLRSTPGYEFLLDQGAQARNRLAAAEGGVVSGNTLLALEEYGQGLADQTFNNYLAQVMGLQNQGVDSIRAGLSVDRGNTLANLRLGAAGARASGVEGQTAAFTGALTGIGNRFGQRASVNQLTETLGGIRLPTKIPTKIPAKF